MLANMCKFPAGSYRPKPIRDEEKDWARIRPSSCNTFLDADRFSGGATTNFTIVTICKTCRATSQPGTFENVTILQQGNQSARDF